MKADCADTLIMLLLVQKPRNCVLIGLPVSRSFLRVKNQPSSAGRPDNELFDRSRKESLSLQAPTGYSFSWLECRSSIPKFDSMPISSGMDVNK
ncbi:Os02g0826625 [Oryza sativa Japonica Group]|uniref:Os02g0826625 protein n=1 Tax=Oryza sativa subsp. japonica TaxID=39947 RepID=A0A0P0VRI6_ORYSJ|nr:Os02g0826625 [Oryza sativa Japonica Group]